MNVFSLIVCYHPDIANLLMLCQTLIKNNCHVIIIDNTEKSYISSNLGFQECSIISLEKNLGIACAQNKGINHAINLGAEIIVFFDQDSKIENSYLPALLIHLKVGEPKIVGPVFFDSIKGIELPSFRLNKLGLPVKVYKQDRFTPYDVDFIISSGSASTMTTFIKAGMMDEDFFIDYVDIEWCIRCRKKNIPIQIIPDAIMMHSIGEKILTFWFLSGFVHSPTRSYYQVRNSFLLLKKKNIPFLMALKEIISVIIHKIILTILVENKISYLKTFFLGIIHGIGGKTGKKPV